VAAAAIHDGTTVEDLEDASERYVDGLVALLRGCVELYDGKLELVVRDRDDARVLMPSKPRRTLRRSAGPNILNCQRGKRVASPLMMPVGCAAWRRFTIFHWRCSVPPLAAV
jgi:hypothetical protein